MRTATLVGLLGLTLASVRAPAQGLIAPPTPPPPLTEQQVLVPGQNVVIVSGTSSVGMKPDLVSVNLGVSTQGPSARKIVDENTAKVAGIIAKLKQRGVRPEQIKTPSFNLGPTEKEGIRTGFEVNSVVGVSTTKVEEAGAMVDAAIDSGATEIIGPEFTVENEKSVQDECIAAAFADAKSKATKLAGLSERRLGKVLAVTDGSSSPFELKSRSGVEGGVLGGVAFEPGTHRVECGVTVAFELREPRRAN